MELKGEGSVSEVNSAYSSTSRITGIYSQLDTDAIVKDLLAVERTKIDKKNQEKTTREWYYDALEKVKNLVEDFQSKYLSALGESSMLSSSVYKSFSVAMDENKAVSITATSSATTGSYKLDRITQLAENASVSSSGISSGQTNISASNNAKLRDLNFARPLVFDDNGKISFSINGVKFSFNSDTTLQNMINTINSDEKAGVTIKYSRLTDGFTITADSGGSASSVTIKNLSGNAFGLNGAFGIGEGTTGKDGFGKAGQDAVCYIENVLVVRDSNEFTIDGITYKLKNETDEAVSFTVSRDFSKTVESISKFIDAYNELEKELNGLLNEKDYSADYKPLTSEQEEAMTETQIEKWNKKAMSGLLRNNRDLESLLRSIKNSFFSALGGTRNTMASIGITTGSYFSKDSGKLIVDEDKLKAALEENPDKVISMFTGSGDGTKGLLYKISDAVKTYLGKNEDDGERAAKEADKLGEKIESMEESLDALAERYYKKYGLMEEALSRMNSMASMLSTLLPG